MKFLKKLKLLSFITMFILFGNVYAALPSNGTYTFINATNNGNGTYTTSDGFFLISTSSAKGVGADQYGAFVRYFDANLYQIEATSGGTDYIEVSVIGGGSFKLTGGVFGEFDQFAELTYNNFTNVYVAGYANGVEVVRTTSHNSPTYETNYNLDFSTPNFSNYVIDKVRVYFTYTTSERPAQLNLESLNISTASTNPPPSANTAPTITGAVASQAVNDTATLSPFSNVTLADTENNNLSITITLDNNAKGVLSGMGLSGTGPYTLSSDTPANVQTKLRALVFNPTDNRVAPASTETTTFTITANDGTDDSTPNNTTTVISTSINDAPTITSTPITTINEDSNYSYTLGATDVDGDGLTWSVKSGTSLPSWLSLNSSSNVTTFAGSGTIGATDATGTAASFYRPFGVAVDSSGNIYVGDFNNHKIRKITPDGVVTTLAGSGTAGGVDGTSSEASFSYPAGVALDSSGNVYVADYGNHKIRKITPPQTTLSGTPTNADAGDYNITLVVSDGVNETEHNFTITVNNVNDAPSDINISSNSIAENSVSGTTIGTLSVTDVDSGDSATFSFCGGVDDGNFIITGITLKSNSVFDYETKSSYSICVRVTDSGSATFDKNITISITDVNENSGGGSTPTPVNGVCGSSNGSPLLLANITNQCNSGTASSITDAGTTYIWSCSGTNGGATANCSVTKPIGTITNHIASTGASGLTGTTFTTESDKEVMTATVTNNDNENITIKVELPTDSNSEIKTKHSVTISTKKTEAISKLEATVDIKSDKSVETKASKDTTDIVVTAKPDGTAEHTVTLSGNVVSKATSNIIGANTVIDENGTVETMAGDVNTTQNGVTYTIKAVAETKADGKTITKFVKVNNNTNDVELIGNTVLPTTPFEAGTNVIIDNIDGTLYIKTSAPLDENLVIE